MGRVRVNDLEVGTLYYILHVEADGTISPEHDIQSFESKYKGIDDRGEIIVSEDDPFDTREPESVLFYSRDTKVNEIPASVEVPILNDAERRFIAEKKDSAPKHNFNNNNNESVNGNKRRNIELARAKAKEDENGIDWEGPRPRRGGRRSTRRNRSRRNRSRRNRSRRNRKH